jgi:hypothetical protein
MTLPEVNALVEHLDSYRLSLKADIQNLTSPIKDRRLPDQRLKLKMLSESQIVSREHATQSLLSPAIRTTNTTHFGRVDSLSRWT